ncbi:MAG: hypothetical protein CME32_11515 [Gimesia sp.]|nr:hypothetical protein [Gimesia sp.]
MARFIVDPNGICTDFGVDAGRENQEHQAACKARFIVTPHGIIKDLGIDLEKEYRERHTSWINKRNQQREMRTQCERYPSSTLRKSQIQATGPRADFSWLSIAASGLIAILLAICSGLAT